MLNSIFLKKTSISSDTKYEALSETTMSGNPKLLNVFLNIEIVTAEVWILLHVHP